MSLIVLERDTEIYPKVVQLLVPFAEGLPQYLACGLVVPHKHLRSNLFFALLLHAIDLFFALYKPKHEFHTIET
jgi:hypothetical protein